MRIWHPDIYIKAWNFASHAHLGQCVPGTDIPYINHLGNVAMEAMTAVAQSGDIEQPDLLIQCALLHDTIEDTPCTHTDLATEFSVEVADGVSALSKDPCLPTKQQQMADSLARITRQPREVWMVKLADRITNLQPPPPHWNSEKIKLYRDEARLILHTLQTANGWLAERLNHKIDAFWQPWAGS